MTTTEKKTRKPATETPAAEPVPFRVRPYSGESNFIAGTWMQSYKGSRWAKAHDSDDFFDFHAPVVSSLIENCTIMVAEHAEKPDVLLGHCVVDRTALGPVLHYVYVKGDYRRQGIGQRLWTVALEQVGWSADSTRPVRYTHKSAGEVWRGITGRRGWKHNGYLAFRFNPWRHAA